MASELPEDVMSNLETLQDRKGMLSRKIGEAKKSGLPVETLIREMKQVTSRIKELTNVKEGSSRETEAKKVDDAEESIIRAEPPHFLAPVVFRDVDDGVTVELAEADPQRWDDYVSKTMGSNGYLRWGFRILIENAFGHQCFYLNALDPRGKVVGVLPLVQIKSRLFGNYFVSIPFFNYGGVLADSPAIESALLNGAIELARKHGAGHIELRGVRQRTDWLEKSSKVSMLLRLPKDDETLFQRIGSKVRAQIRKADRFSFRFILGKQECIDDFYAVFAQNMRDLGTPVYAKQFFYELFQGDLIGDAHVAVLYLNEKPVSAAILVGFKDTLEIPWASTLKSVNATNANMMLYWSVLKSAIAKGYRYFDFGRSSPDAGTYRFKRQWGAEPVPLYWQYWLSQGDELPELNPNNPKYKLLIAMWKKLPVWLTKIVGPFVVKSLP